MEAFVECQVNPRLVWNLDYEPPPAPPPSPVDDELNFDKVVPILVAETKTMNHYKGSCNYKEQMMMMKKKKKKKKMILKLNYEAVINAWDSQASPWTTGIRPQINPHNFWPNFIGFGDDNHEQPHARPGGIVNNNNNDGGREAILSRYREKRRTRRLTLSKKKIRYEIRKLNAEKRPRLNGRFVKTKKTSIVHGYGDNINI